MFQSSGLVRMIAAAAEEVAGGCVEGEDNYDGEKEDEDN